MSEVISTVEYLSCVFCGPYDGTHEIPKTKNCVKCKRAFCPAHASRITQDCCKECFAEFSVVVEEHTKVDTEYDEKSDSIITHRSSGDRIKLDGPDYVWYNITVSSLNDAELALSIQFHRYMVSRLALETTIRLVKKTQELQGQPVSKGRISTTTTTTKTKKVKQQKSLKEILMASGITDPVILASMLAAAGVKE
jgi:hypothetical protein